MAGVTTGVAVQIREEDGDLAHGGVGAGPRSAMGAAATPYLLAALPAPTLATGVRVVISGAGSSPPAAATAAAPVDVAVLGPTAGP